MIRFFSVFAAAIAVFLAPARAGEPTPLFGDDEIINIRLEGPIRDLVRKAQRSTDPYPATLILEGASPETHAIELSARGKSRRDPNVCKFPPLRVEFLEKPAKGSLFRKQKKLKLVTHCKSSASYQQYYLVEYVAYRLLNVLTPQSFRVRLANVVYFDNEKGKEVAARIGFFIEDVDDMARRVDMKEVERPDLMISQLDPAAAGRTALFHYMIGNLDWSLIDGPEGDDCCHNGKVIGASADATSGLVVAPYDFDYSGLVNAPYALPPDGVKARNVRQRVYRGYCAHNAEALAAAAAYRANSAALIAQFDGVPGLADRTRSKALSYLEQFFDDIADDEMVEKKLLDDCRG